MHVRCIEVGKSTAAERFHRAIVTGATCDHKNTGFIISYLVAEGVCISNLTRKIQFLKFLGRSNLKHVNLLYFITRGTV